MVTTEEILTKIGNRTKTLNKIIAVVGPVAIAIGGVFWYFNNIWKPSVKIIEADYEKLFATINVNGKTRILYAGSTINAGWGWGIKFASADGIKYNRIELVKNELTFKTISIYE